MEAKITGDMRCIAESAWVSTLSEIRAKARGDDDVEKVVTFLVRNQHTSPLEAVTLSFIAENDSEIEELELYRDNYTRIKGNVLTADLLNFVKLSMVNNLYNNNPFRLFSEAHPKLAQLCKKFAPIGKADTIENVGEVLGEHGMSVELIDLHDMGDPYMSRAKWRVKCPLSIAVQLLRHRKTSPNMSSGRYRTLNQDIVGAVDDCRVIFKKVGIDLEDYLEIAHKSTEVYKVAMKAARGAKKEENITNDEYKRFREFARFILPEGRMTELVVTFYLDDFYNNYVILRDSVHSQVEHIWVAQQMQDTLREKYAE